MTPATLGTRFLDFWFAPLAPARWRLFERAFSVTFLIWFARWSWYGREWLTDYGFHISAEATNQVYPAPFPLLPAVLLFPFIAVVYANTIAIILGVGGRPVRMLQFAIAVYVQLVDQPSSFTLNKLYIFFYFVMAVAPSLQRVRVARDDDDNDVSDDDGAGSDAPVLRQSAWPVRTVQATLLIQYCTAGTCKAYWGDWMDHTDILFGHSVGIYRTWIAGLVVTYMPHFFFVALSATSLAFEIFAPVLFMWKRTRLFACAFGVLLHAGIALLMKDLIFFSQQMVTFYVVFLPTSWVLLADGKIDATVRGWWQKLRPRKSD